MKNKSQKKKRIGNQPVLVRFDKDMISQIDHWKRDAKLKSRPAAVRYMISTLTWYWPRFTGHRP